MEFNKDMLFSSLDELQRFVCDFEKANCFQLWKRDSRTIDTAQKNGIKRALKEDLKYYSITYACILGG